MNELDFILHVESLIAEEYHMASIYRQYGRVPIEQREKVKRMRKEVKDYCAKRRLTIIAERNQQNSLPKQSELFS